MSIYSPILISANAQCGPWASTTFGTIAIGSNLYVFEESGAATSGIFMSTDGGITWVEQDSANNIPSSNATSFYDAPNSRFVVAFRVAGGGPQEIHLRNFSVITNTWSIIYGTGAGVPTDCQDMGAIQIRPNGTFAVLYDNAPPAPGVGVSNAIVAIFGQPFGGTSGAWITSVDIGVNVRAEAGWLAFTKINVNRSGVGMSSSGLMHFTLSNDSSGLYTYQALNLNNTLGTYHKFTENLQVFSGLPLGNPVIYNGFMVIPAVIRSAPDNFATVYVAPNPAVPVFTPVAVPPGIESADSVTNFLTPDNVPRLAVSPDGGTLYAVYSAFDILGTAYQDIHIAYTTSANPATGWNESNVFKLATDSPPGFNYVGQQLQLAGANIATPNQILLSVDANHPTVPHNEERYWMGNFVNANPSVGPGFSSALDPRKLSYLTLPNPNPKCS